MIYSWQQFTLKVKLFKFTSFFKRFTCMRQRKEKKKFLNLLTRCRGDKAVFQFWRRYGRAVWRGAMVSNANFQEKKLLKLLGVCLWMAPWKKGFLNFLHWNLLDFNTYNRKMRLNSTPYYWNFESFSFWKR